MEKLIASRINGGNTAPPEPTIALMNFLQLPKDTTVIWEPACGEMNMAVEMEKMGYSVYATDIQTGKDFLNDLPDSHFDWIITNPPFSLSEQFIRRCHNHNKPFALLLKSQYWHAKKRLSLFEETHPSYLLSLTWRPDFFFGKRGSGSPLMDVMWVVWDTEYSGKYPLYIPLEKPEIIGG